MSQSPERRWEGWHYDGRTSNRYAVGIRVLGSGLAILPQEGGTRHWPYDRIRYAPGAHAGEPVRFEYGGDPPEVLVVPDTAILAAIHRAAPAVQRRFRPPTKVGRFLAGTIVVAIALVVVSVALYVWGIPALAVTVAARIPVAWEEQLGAAAIANLTSIHRRCDAPAQLAALEQIVERLTASIPSSPYRYRLTVIASEMPNAFAAPGGHLLMTSELLRFADRPEEIAGVLAHEIQHVEHRHATRLLVRELSMRTLISLALGDLRGLGSAVDAAGRLGTLRYQRADETAADRGAVPMLVAARIDPRGMVTMLQKLQGASRGFTPPLYLSTHPALEERIATLNALIDQTPVTTAPLLPEYPWREVTEICS